MRVHFPRQVNVSMLVRYTLQMIGSLAFMFYLNAALTGVLLAVVPIVSIVAVQYGGSNISIGGWGGSRKRCMGMFYALGNTGVLVYQKDIPL